MSVKPIKAPTNAGDFELTPAGVYLARCYKMIDLGTQTITSPKFGTSKKRQVMLYWELLQNDSGEKVAMEDGKPFGINKTYTLSMHKKAGLRADLNSWRGVPFTEEEANEFDITKLLDKFCTIQVVHNKSGDKTYANVGAIMNTTKTTKGVNEIIGFSVDDPDMEVFKDLPEWLKDKITSSVEWEDDNNKIDPESFPEAETKEDKPLDVSGVPF